MNAAYKLCSICSEQLEEKIGAVCQKCLAFMGQDHVAQRELQMEPENLQKLTTNLIGHSEQFPWADPQKPDGIPSFETFLKNAKLTNDQKKVLRLKFIDNQSFFEIGQQLGISKESAQDRYRGAVKKLKKYPSNLRWVRGKSEFKIDPYDYYSSCPKCGHTDLHGKVNKGSCLNCGWAFIVDNDSHQ